MTLEHERLTADDVRVVLRHGVSKRAVAEAMEVAFLFNVYDRMADAMGWHVPDVAAGYYQAGARRLLKHGYR